MHSSDIMDDDSTRRQDPDRGTKTSASRREESEGKKWTELD